MSKNEWGFCPSGNWMGSAVYFLLHWSWNPGTLHDSEVLRVCSAQSPADLCEYVINLCLWQMMLSKYKPFWGFYFSAVQSRGWQTTMHRPAAWLWSSAEIAVHVYVLSMPLSNCNPVESLKHKSYSLQAWNTHCYSLRKSSLSSVLMCPTIELEVFGNCPFVTTFYFAHNTKAACL